MKKGIHIVLKKRTYGISLITILFFIHGILYFLFPSDIYNASSPIKLIKYILLLITFVLCFNSNYVGQLIKYSILFIYLFLMHYISIGNIADTVFLNYVFPMLLIVMYGEKLKRIDMVKITAFVYVFSSIMGYYEYMFRENYFSRFSSWGYRVCSIFVNPNNFAVVLIIFCFVLLFNTKSILIKLGILFNTAVLLRLTGSRIGLLVYAGGILLVVLYRLYITIISNWKVNKRFLLFFYVVIFGGIISAPVLQKGSQIFASARKIGEADLFMGRLGQLQGFFDNVLNSPFFPSRESYQYTDNVYLHIWGYYGLISLIVFLVFYAYVLYKAWKVDKRVFLLLLLFCVVGFAENFIYLWPQGYIFWFLVIKVLSFEKTNNAYEVEDKPDKVIRNTVCSDICLENIVVKNGKTVS